MIKKIDHIVITARDMKESIVFYEALGFVAKEEVGRYALFAGDFKINVHQAGAEQLPHAKCVQPGSADFCFEIGGELSAFLEDLQKKGIALEMGIVGRHGVKGEMKSFYLRDPDGNLLEFCCYHNQ